MALPLPSGADWLFHGVNYFVPGFRKPVPCSDHEMS